MLFFVITKEMVS